MESNRLICQMENTDTEFYEKIDKRMAEILASPSTIIETVTKNTIENNDEYSNAPPVSEIERGQLEFSKDIENGEKGEDFTIGFTRRLLEQRGKKVIILEHLSRQSNVSKSKMKELDYKLRIIDVKTQVVVESSYEVKTDMFQKKGNTPKERNSGNMAIEFSCRGSDSGIKVTKADWFVTYYPIYKEIWYIKTDELRELIDKNNFRQVPAGDLENGKKVAMVYLIPRYKFKEKFKFYSTENI